MRVSTVEYGFRQGDVRCHLFLNSRSNSHDFLPNLRLVAAVNPP